MGYCIGKCDATKADVCWMMVDEYPCLTCRRCWERPGFKDYVRGVRRDLGIIPEPQAPAGLSESESSAIVATEDA